VEALAVVVLCRGVSCLRRKAEREEDKKKIGRRRQEAVVGACFTWFLSSDGWQKTKPGATSVVFACVVSLPAKGNRSLSWKQQQKKKKKWLQQHCSVALACVWCTPVCPEQAQLSSPSLASCNAIELKEVLEDFIEKQRKGQQLDRQEPRANSCHVGVNHLFER
jgi:cytochrome c553